jgi:predicted hydrocarbon binding protein
VTITESELMGLAHEVREVFGSGSGIILHHAGFGIGREMAEGIEKLTNEKKDIYKGFQTVWRNRGWGTASIEESSESPGEGKVSFIDSPLPKEDPVHETLEMLVRGIFSGFMARAFGTDKISIQKEDCVAKGDRACTFSFKIERNE